MPSAHRMAVLSRSTWAWRGVLAAAVLLGLLAPASTTGMGVLDEDSPTTRIPEPSTNFKVRITDVELATYEATRASFDGHVFLTGLWGKTKVSVPFEKIDKVMFDPGEGSEIVAIVSLRDGTNKTLSVRGTTPCFGEATFGNVSVQVRHLRDVVFLGRVLR